MKRRACVYLAILTLLPALAWGMPHGTVILHDGRRFEDVDYEVRGQEVRVVSKYGATLFPMTDVLRIIPHARGSKADDEQGDASSAGGAPASRPGEDWATRFLLEAPSGWSLAPAAGPLSRARMRSDSGAVVDVSVRPAGAPWVLDAVRGRMDREVGDAIRDEHRARYARVTGGRYRVVLFKGAPVVRIDRFALSEHGSDRGDALNATEVRFQQFGLEYALTYMAGKDAWPRDEAEIDAALEAFSFLPPVEATEEGFSDLERGFAFRLPEAKWTVRSRPFATDDPVVAASGDGRAAVELAVDPRRDDPKAAVQALFEGRRKQSRYFQNDKVRDVERGGQALVEFAFEDFSPDGSKALRFHGLASAVAGGVLIATGSSPTTDEDAKKLELEVDAVLDSLQVRDPAKIASEIQGELGALAQLARGSEALRQKKGAEAIDAFDQAIAAAPRYALAYALRAEAKKLTGDFDGSRADLAEAARLDPNGGYAAEATETLAAEAAAAQKNKQWREATELWIRAYQAKQDDKALKNVLSCASSLFKEYRQDKKDSYEGSKVMEELLEKLETNPEVAEELAKMHSQAIADLAGEGDFSKAKKVLRRIKNLARANKSDALEAVHDKAKERLKQAEDKARGK